MATEIIKPEIIYCAAGNERFADIAIEHGFTYGAQPIRTYYRPIGFADIHPKYVPPKDLYVAAIRKARPRITTVKDWAREDELPEVLGWAEEIAPFTEVIIVTPKVVGGIKKIPRFVGNKPIRLGYSVPTRHGGTLLMPSEFAGWEVHLLGGSPQQQRLLTYYLDVVSVDGNMAQKMATGQTKSRIVAVWQPDSKKYKKGYWVPLDEYRATEFGLSPVEHDAPYVAFEYSCRNIMAMWRQGAT